MRCCNLCAAVEFDGELDGQLLYRRINFCHYCLRCCIYILAVLKLVFHRIIRLSQ